MVSIMVYRIQFSSMPILGLLKAWLQFDGTNIEKVDFNLLDLEEITGQLDLGNAEIRPCSMHLLPALQYAPWRNWKPPTLWEAPIQAPRESLRVQNIFVLSKSSLQQHLVNSTLSKEWRVWLTGRHMTYLKNKNICFSSNRALHGNP